MEFVFVNNILFVKRRELAGHCVLGHDIVLVLFFQGSSPRIVSYAFCAAFCANLSNLSGMRRCQHKRDAFFRIALTCI